MALNLATFKTRALTALVFVVVMIGGLYWNIWSFLLLFSVIHAGCWYEYEKLMAQIYPPYGQITPFHRYGIIVAGWAIMLLMTNKYFALGTFTFASLGWWLLLLFALVFPITEILLTRQVQLKSIGISLLGLVYISLPCALMMWIRSYKGWAYNDLEPVLDFTGVVHPFIIVVAIWVNDTMAYIVGSLIGRRPFFPAISPKKTWEGTLGGILLATTVLSLVGVKTLIYGLPDWIWMTLLASVFGTIGDLFESKLKRMAGVKDSGSFMPGHGGFLDRFDSLLWAIPPVWLYMKYFLDPS